MRTLPPAIALALVLLASTCGPTDSTSVTQDPATDAAPRVTLRISGELDGYLEPCGCAANQLGGLARRAFKLREDRSFDMLVEGGNTIATNTELDVDKLLEILQVLDDSSRRYHALGIAKRDLELLDDSFFYLLEGRGLTAVSSDLVPKELDGTEWPVAPFVERTFDQVTVRLASLTLEVPDGHAVRDPSEAWRAAMDGVASDSIRVLMAHGPRAKINEFVDLEPRPHLIIEINPIHPHPPDAPRIVDDVPIVHPGTRGRFLVDVTLARMDDGVRVTRYRPIALEGSKTAPGAMQDENVVQSLIQHRIQVKDSGLRELMADQLPTPTDGATYVGSEECAVCHEMATEQWLSTKHAHAWTTLEKAEYSDKYPWPVTYYPDCVECHVVGYRQKSGFINPEQTPHLMHVGCEECHGPGSKHIDNPRKGDFREQTLDICMKCHTFEQTPTFAAEYDRFWKAIEHGHDPDTEVTPDESGK